tara:strand:- start:2739 stop:3386 length:648 start_codon:yes stop_codon:yes gene_type:complete
MSKNLALFGATGGLGKKLLPKLQVEYNVIPISSNDVDITDFGEVKRFFLDNDIDIVINLSGKKYDTFLGKISEEDIPHIQDMVNVNIMGNINLLGACLAQMRNKEWGRVILISSVFSELNVPKNSIYCSSKSFLDRMVQVANKESISKNITCNSIQLGYWDGGMCYRVPEEIQEKAKQKVGLKRWGSIDELFNTIKYMIENEYVSGTNLRIDGGL